MTKRKNIIQPPEVWAAWSKIAEAKGWTMAHLIFEAVKIATGSTKSDPGEGGPSPSRWLGSGKSEIRGLGDCQAP